MDGSRTSASCTCVLFLLEDAIVGIKQSVTRLCETMAMNFKRFAPADATVETYGGRALESVCAKSGKVPANIRKFRDAPLLIHWCNLTGATENELLSMAIANYLGNRNGLAYDAQPFLHT